MIPVQNVYDFLPAIKQHLAIVIWRARGEMLLLDQPQPPPIVPNRWMRAADLESNSETSYASVRTECERAIKSFRQGNHSKALKLTEELCSKYKNPSHLAFIHRVQAATFLDLASVISEPKARGRYCESATEAASQMVSLSPRSIEFAVFYADLLFLLANEGEQYDKVVQVCEKALAIENPVDPLNESLQDRWKDQKFTTAESRVAHVQTELRSLLQKSNIASISTWMKNLGNEQKFELMPLSGIVDDKMVQDSADMRLVRESKTAEYGKKETEANMVSDWLEQQMSESSSPGNKVNGHNDNNKELMKRDKQRKTTHSNEMERVRPYWNSMSSDRKKDLLKVKITDLQEYLGRAFKDGSANAVLDEAISFGKENNVWAFWMCCRCNCKFSHDVSFTQHVVKEHLPGLPSELEPLLPESVEDKWAEKNLNCSWKPLDLNALIRMLKKQSEPEVPESRDMPCPERAMLLEKILVFLQGLFKQKYLAKSHIKRIELAAARSLQGLACGSQLDCSSISDQTNLFIRALGAPELQKTLKFLEDIFLNASRLGQYSDANSGVQDAYTTMEKTVLSEDASYLVLAEHFVPCSNPLASCDDGGSNASTSPNPSYEAGATLDSDSLLSWIFTASSSAKELASWTRVREDGTKRGLEILQLLQKEYSQVRDSCKIKYEHMKYYKALKEMDGLCLQEVTKGKQATNSVPHTQSYKTVLMTRQEELIKNSKGTTVSSKVNIITDVLKDAKSLNDQKDYFHKTYSVVSENHNWRTKDSPHTGDFCIELSVRRKLLEVSSKFNKMDTRIVQIMGESRKLTNKLDAASSHDFRSILIPLVKAFLRACLGDLAEKEAKKESDASKEALLQTEFALDSKKDKKKKKKKKRNGKKKYPEVINSDIPRDQTAEEILLTISDDVEIPGSEISISYTVDDDADPVTNGDRRLQEENSHIMGLEAEASDVQVTLEYYRQIEDAAKQDHLCEQHNGTKQKAEIIDNSKNYRSNNILEGSATANASMLSSRSSSEQHTDPNKLSDGINQTLASEKKDIDADSPVFGDLYGTGLRNGIGENNCFLNVIIQSSWHLRLFRDEFLRKQLEHGHVGDPCVVCALYEIFNALSTASAHNTREAVDPVPLRVALSKLYPAKPDVFKKGERHDPSEALWEILKRLHQSFSPSPVKETESELVDGDCTNDCCCIAQSIFGMDIAENTNCVNCGLESRYLQYSSFYHTSYATALRMMKAKFPNNSFDELLYLVERDQEFICDSEAGGCGKPTYKNLNLSTAPQVFITFLGLHSHESAEDIAATLAALSTDINISCLYRNLASHNRHRLISMVCYNAQHKHYICFCYSHYNGKWIMYDDETVEVIDCWDDVVTMCARQRYMRPQILFFESVN